VKVFLDENLPLTLVHRLRDDGHEADHVITVGWRGASDARIGERLLDTNLLFLTQDEDFLFTQGLGALIVLSRIRQARPLRERIGIWRSAVRELIENPRSERRFELLDDGTLVPWEEGPQSTWTSRAPRR